MTEETIRGAIEQAIADNPVILFMKGTPEAPGCGFSARVVACLKSLDAPFAAIDVLPDPAIRQNLTAISSWPTIPQLFVKGELVGGCDIVSEMFTTGELATVLGLDPLRELPKMKGVPVAMHGVGISIKTTIDDD